jgi:hypothetical protein
MVEGDFVGIMQAAGLPSDFVPEMETAPEAGSFEGCGVVGCGGTQPPKDRNLRPPNRIEPRAEAEQ